MSETGNSLPRQGGVDVSDQPPGRNWPEGVERDGDEDTIGHDEEESIEEDSEYD